MQANVVNQDMQAVGQPDLGYGLLAVLVNALLIKIRFVKETPILQLLAAVAV
jgi:hypothetical protein